MSEHTPAPWEYRPHRHDDWGWIRGPKPDGEHIAPLVALARGGSWENEKTFDDHRAAGTDPYAANAAFIVKAVNNHDALLCVVRQMIEAVDSGNLQMSSPEIGEPENNIPIHQWHEELLHYAREALRAVEPSGGRGK